jgi:hypothetical protein
VTANVTFRDLTKTEVLSNDLKVNLNLAEESATAATAGEDAAIEDGSSLVGESEQEQDSSPLLQPDQEGEDEEAAEDENDEGQSIPSAPLFG